MVYKFEECAYHYRKMEGERKIEQENMQNMIRENLALKDEVKKLTRPESDVVYDLKEEFKKVEEKKDKSIKAAERRYETCNAEKEQLKADATHMANTDSEWKKTAFAKDQEKIEVEKQLHESRAHVTELQTTVKEAEKAKNALQKEIKETVDMGKALEQRHNETVSQMCDLQKEHDNTLVKARGLENKCNGLTDEHTRLQDDYDEFSEETKILQSSYESLIEDNMNLEHQLKTLQNDHAEARKMLDQFILNSSELLRLPYDSISIEDLWSLNANREPSRAAFRCQESSYKCAKSACIPWSRVQGDQSRASYCLQNDQGTRAATDRDSAYTSSK